VDGGVYSVSEYFRRFIKPEEKKAEVPDVNAGKPKPKMTPLSSFTVSPDDLKKMMNGDKDGLIKKIMEEGALELTEEQGEMLAKLMEENGGTLDQLVGADGEANQDLAGKIQELLLEGNAELGEGVEEQVNEIFQRMLNGG
jgi:hypothetical protein